MNKKTIALLLFTVMIPNLFLIGCFPAIRMDIKNTPSLKGHSPLNDIKSIKMIFSDFKDERPDKESIGNGFNQDGGILTNDNVVEVVQDAIENEIKRNGHNIIKDKYVDNVNLEIGGAVTEYWLAELWENSAKGVTGAYEGVVKTVITVKNYETDSILLTKEYYGSEKILTEKLFGAVKSRKDTMDASLLNLVKDFTRDPEFLMILK